MNEARVRYTEALADRMRAEGVALRESGAYVHRSFDACELEQLATVARAGIDFVPEVSMIVARGRGCLVRHGRLSKDRKIAKMLGGVISLSILEGEAFSERDFAREVMDGPGIRVLVASSGEERVGILYGSLDEPYAVLVDVAGGKVRCLDIETQERSNNRHVVVKVLPLRENDGARAEEVRRALSAIAKPNLRAT